MKFISFCLFSFLFSQIAFAQNNSTTDGNWSTSANWSSGVPTATQTVNVGNNMILDQNISINNGGDYTVTASITDASGGSKYDINLVAGATLDIDGNIKIEGNLSLFGLCTFTIRSGDTLVVGGNANIDGISYFKLENNAVFIINGDFVAKNFTASLNNGTIYVNGNATFDNFSFLSGNGSFQSIGSTTITNSSNVFGQTAGCPNNCQFGSGAGLPIVLKSFTAQLDPINRGMADLEWTTQSEINNNYFTLYYATNGKNFEKVAKVIGAGNSNKEVNYKVKVPLKVASTHYFRLSQTDYDGTTVTFDPISLNISSQFTNFENDKEFTVYPNPSNGEQLKLKGINLNKGTYRLLLFNSNGKLVIQKSFEINANEGLIQTEIINGNSLSKGLYFLKIQSNTKDYKQKVLVN